MRKTPRLAGVSGCNPDAKACRFESYLPHQTGSIVKEQICEMLLNGNSYDEIVSVVGCRKSSISYHASRLGLSKPINKRIYDWEEISIFYETNTFTETRKKFGFSKRAWEKAIVRGDIVSRGYSDVIVPLDEILDGKHPSYNTGLLKKRLIKERIIEEKCVECGIGNTHNGKLLVLHLDHINGVSNDHRMMNIRLLCPNCHSQTDTYAGRNKKN